MSMVEKFSRKKILTGPEIYALDSLIYTYSNVNTIV